MAYPVAAPSGRFRTRAGLRLAAPFAALLLAGCGTFGGDEPPPACPQVLILADAQHFTTFRGPGRDISDIEAEGEIAGFQGACETTDDGLELTLALGFEITRGAADTDRVAEFAYFVAVPDFYPDPAAKAVMPVRVAFPENVSSVRYVDEQVTLDLPLQAGESARQYEVFIGFQLSDEQLRYNRANPR